MKRIGMICLLSSLALAGCVMEPGDEDQVDVETATAEQAKNGLTYRSADQPQQTDSERIAIEVARQLK